jgi:hypothetical protein
VVGRGGRAAERLWWLTGFSGFGGENAGEGRTLAMPELLTAAPTGVVTLLEASMEHSSPTFPASSGGNPRSGLLGRRWRRYGVVFPLGGFAF